MILCEDFISSKENTLTKLKKKKISNISLNGKIQTKKVKSTTSEAIKKISLTTLRRIMKITILFLLLMLGTRLKKSDQLRKRTWQQLHNQAKSYLMKARKRMKERIHRQK